MFAHDGSLLWGGTSSISSDTSASTDLEVVAGSSPGISFGVCQASCPISYAANTAFLSNSLLSFDGFSQTSLTGFQWRTERFFQRSGLASLAVS